MGPVAEPAVLQQLQHPDESVRTEACRILKVMGTKESIPVLQELARRKRRLASAANETLKALTERQQ